MSRGAPKALRGTVQVPGDKSITHRAILFSALAAGKTTIVTDQPGRDNLASLRILGQLGVGCRIAAPATFKSLLQSEGFLSVDESPGKDVRIEISSSGFKTLQPPTAPLNCGNSGTTSRLLCGFLAGAPFSATLTGDESLKRRPFERVTEPLSQMGARFSGDRLPLTISGGALHGIEYRSKVASAQVKSAILLAALHADGETTLTEPMQSRDHTERMFRAMGIQLNETKTPDGTWQVSMRGGQTARALGEIRIPGDFSSAAFFLVAASVVLNSDVTIEGVLFNPTRTGLFSILSRMGAQIETKGRRIVGGEEIVDLRVQAHALRGTTVSAEDVVLAIDEIPILAVAAALAEGETVIRGAAELRVKESDRIALIAELLQAFGVGVEEFPDGLRITGKPDLARSGMTLDGKKHARWRESGDHRIAMAGMILTYAVRGEVPLTDRAAVETSFPDFPELFSQLMG